MIDEAKKQQAQQEQISKSLHADRCKIFSKMFEEQESIRVALQEIIQAKFF
ncbi:MAG TPA: hypothetical protein VI757_11525 [Bacteroidia bacterium]|nr:hypothetical protein [Bacteroidia bacterium]